MCIPMFIAIILVSTDKQFDKEVAHIHNGILLSLKKELEPHHFPKHEWTQRVLS